MKKLEISHIRKTFKNRTVVEDVSLKVQQGEVVGLLGPNGAGKTTTFRIILGFYRPDRGHVLLDGRDISAYPIYIRSRLGIYFLPQEPSIFRGLTIWENMLAIAQMVGKGKMASIGSILEDMGLAQLKDQKAYLLSGGERRRLEIARSLLLSPDFLLLDEPFAGIDPIQIQDLKKLILKFKQKQMGVIITDHNVREILAITDHSYIIHLGHVIFSGNSQDLLVDPEVKKNYLGEEFRWN